MDTGVSVNTAKYDYDVARQHAAEVMGRRGYLVIGSMWPLTIGTIIPGKELFIRSDGKVTISPETNFIVAKETDWQDMVDQWANAPHLRTGIEKVDCYLYRVTCD